MSRKHLLLAAAVTDATVDLDAPGDHVQLAGSERDVAVPELDRDATVEHEP